MLKTRNLFVLNGTEQDVNSVLDQLQFKGLVVLPPGRKFTYELLKDAFAQNRSFACSVHSFETMLPENALVIDALCESDDKKIHFSNRFINCTSDSSVAKQFEKIALEYDLDIGDHKSNSSGQTQDITRADCAYCRYLDGNVGENERTVYMSKNFFVLPTVGEFCRGYLLIIPIKHVMSNADLEPSVIKEFKEVLYDIEYILRLTYDSNVLVWENGSGGQGQGKAKDSIVHSHVHIAPSYLTSDDIEAHLKLPFEDVTLDTLEKHHNHPYLLVRSHDEEIWRICDSSSVYIPRQYVRQILGEEHGLPAGDFWNWRIHPFTELMLETRKDLSKTILDNWLHLSERIKERTEKFLF